MKCHPLTATRLCHPRGMVTVSQKEFQRVRVIENAVDGRLSVGEAAGLLKLSERQVQRPGGTGETPVLHFRCEPSCKFFHLDDKPKPDQTLPKVSGC